jgi:hypothetical protein
MGTTAPALLTGKRVRVVSVSGERDPKRMVDEDDRVDARREIGHVATAVYDAGPDAPLRMVKLEPPVPALDPGGDPAMWFYFSDLELVD